MKRGRFSAKPATPEVEPLPAPEVDPYWNEVKAYWEAYAGARHWKSMAQSYVRQGARAAGEGSAPLEAHCRDRLEALRKRVESSSPSPSPSAETPAPFSGYDERRRASRLEDLRLRLLQARRRLRPMETQAFAAGLGEGERLLGLREALQDREWRAATARLDRLMREKARRRGDAVPERAAIKPTELGWGPYNERGTLLESVERLRNWDPDWVAGWESLYAELDDLASALSTR